MVPALGAILVYLSTTRDIVYGTALLLVFAYGMGLVLILAGTFSVLLLRLPKPGRWMEYTKKILAVILILAGAYFVYLGIGRV